MVNIFQLTIYFLFLQLISYSFCLLSWFLDLFWINHSKKYFYIFLWSFIILLRISFWKQICILDSLPLSIQAAFIKYHRLGGLWKTEIYLLQLWRLEVWDQCTSVVRVWWEPSSGPLSPINSSKLYLLIPSHWELVFQHRNFREDKNLSVYNTQCDIIFYHFPDR